MAQKAGERSPMYVSISSRLLGVVVTIFILILTIKSELLSSWLITAQLILSIPFLMGEMLSRVKITDIENVKKYHPLNKFFQAIAFGFVFNTIGLLISKYVSFLAGIIYFIAFIIVLLLFIFVNFRNTSPFERMMEILMIAIMIILGFLPAIGVISF